MSTQLTTKVSHNTKIKSTETKQAIKTTNYPIKNIIAPSLVGTYE
jgi:hypothetical protein